jgi:hypothetical protein
MDFCAAASIKLQEQNNFMQDKLTSPLFLLLFFSTKERNKEKFKFIQKFAHKKKQQQQIKRYNCSDMSGDW